MRADSSGDLIADRRFAYAAALAREGHVAAAAELAAEAVGLAPDWAPGWFVTGEYRERAGDAEGAREAYEQALARAPDDRLGAALRLARLGARPAPAAPPAGHVAALFDEYAPRFDAHLTGTLGYRGPEALDAALRAALAARGASERFARALDLGCGTGLMGRRLRPRAERLEGVDLSPRMIALAAETGLYDALRVGDGVEDLAAHPAGSLDLVTAADVLVYLGDLAPLFRAAARAVAPGGLLAFTTQSHEGDGDWRLGADLRYAHAPAHLRRLAEEARFETVSLDAQSLRQDGGRPVPGLVAVLRRAG